jgi:hypothetical protein
MDEWEYTYTYVDNAEKFNNLNFEKVLLVTQMNFPTKISRDYYIEKYAKGTGLAYREIINLDYKAVYPEGTSWQNILNKSGVVYTQKIISWGTE